MKMYAINFSAMRYFHEIDFVVLHDYKNILAAKISLLKYTMIIHLKMLVLKISPSKQVRFYSTGTKLS